jgi:hypothetical protein
LCFNSPSKTFILLKRRRKVAGPGRSASEESAFEDFSRL